MLSDKQTNLKTVAAGLCALMVALLPAPASALDERTTDAGNKKGVAADLMALSGTVNVTGSVGGGDASDYFRFTLAGPTTVQVSLTGLTKNADLALAKPGRRQNIKISKKTGTADESISVVVQAGEYFVRVYRPRGLATDYSLAITATAYTPPPVTAPTTDDGAGSKTTRAASIGDLQAVTDEQAAIDGALGGKDKIDFFSFELSSADQISINLTNLQDDVQLTLYDKRGRVITKSANTGTSDESITSDLAAGKYYVRVKAADGVTSQYNLALATSNATPPADDPPAEDPPDDDPPPASGTQEFRDNSAGVYGKVVGRVIVLVGVDALVATGSASTNIEYGEVTVDSVVVTPKRVDTSDTLGSFLGGALFSSIPQDVRDRATSYIVLSSSLGTAELTLWSHAADPVSPQRVLVTWDAGVIESYDPSILRD